jgi:hypothetical protein
MIDWTQPIETTETPPRPVRVLATDLAGLYPVAGIIHDSTGSDFVWRFTADGRTTATRQLVEGDVHLRNVAPPKPKPKPVLREAWVAWDSDGMETVWSSEKGAADRARHLRGVYTRAATMSDGSPVPGEDDYVGMMGKIAMLEQQRDSLKAEIAHRERWLGDARAEVLRMKPVVDAVVAWFDSFPLWMMEGREGRLADVVRVYQNTQPATSESHEAMAEEAVANVAAMMGPLKTCNNCKHNGPTGCGAWHRCPSFQMWEPKQ